MKIGKKKLSQMAEEWRGNHTKWKSFAWILDRPDDYENWCIVETHHRDSDAKAVSNGRYFHKHMNPLVDDTEDVIEWGAGHFAVGHTDGWAVRVLDKEGKPTRAFKVLAGLLCEREERDILDPKDYRERMAQGARDNIKFAAEHCLPKGMELVESLPDNWVERVEERLDELDEYWRDDLDSDGTPFPKGDELLTALKELKLVQEEAA